MWDIVGQYTSGLLQGERRAKQVIVWDIVGQYTSGLLQGEHRAKNRSLCVGHCRSMVVRNAGQNRYVNELLYTVVGQGNISSLQAHKAFINGRVV